MSGTPTQAAYAIASDDIQGMKQELSVDARVLSGKIALNYSAVHTRMGLLTEAYIVEQVPSTIDAASYLPFVEDECFKIQSTVW